MHQIIVLSDACAHLMLVATAARPTTASLQGVCFDLSGVLHIGDTAITNASKAVSLARSAGLRVAFVSNTSKATSAQLLKQLTSLGIDARASEVCVYGWLSWCCGTKAIVSSPFHSRLVSL